VVGLYWLLYGNVNGVVLTIEAGGVSRKIVECFHLNSELYKISPLPCHMVKNTDNGRNQLPEL
jgi:hypothetical protein